MSVDYSGPRGSGPDLVLGIFGRTGTYVGIRGLTSLLTYF